MPADMNDSLDNLFNGDTGPVEPFQPVRAVPVYKTAVERFEEGCPKCRGTGNFVSYTGRIVGQCFACKGLGKKVFKTSSATRAVAREKAADKKAATSAADVAAFTAREPDVMAWIVAECSKAKPFEFAVAMAEAINKYGDLTDRQLDTCKRLAAKAAERASSRANGPALDVAAIEAAFVTAREKAFRTGQMGTFIKPLILAAGPAKTDIAFKASAGSGKWEGMVFFKSMDDRKLGYVKEGRFNRQFACTDAEANAVLTVASNPKEGLFAYAKAWSKCGVCGRGLLNDESIERGIGPICMEKYGFA